MNAKYQKSFHIRKKKKKIKDRLIRDIWTLFETEEGKEERKKLERNENIMKY